MDFLYLSTTVKEEMPSTVLLERPRKRKALVASRRGDSRASLSESIRAKRCGIAVSCRGFMNPDIWFY